MTKELRPDAPLETQGTTKASIEGSTTFSSTDGEMLKVSSSGFYVRGVKLEQDEAEARAVFDAFKQWLNQVNWPSSEKQDTTLRTKYPLSMLTDTAQRAPTQAGERATLAADQVQANAPESDALPDRRTQQIAYPGIDKRKVRGETPRTDAEIEHPQNILIENAQAERRGEKVSYEVVRADFARQLELEADFYKLAATMQRENQEHAEAELNKALRELADALKGLNEMLWCETRRQQ